MKIRSLRTFLSCILTISALWAFYGVKPFYAQGQLATATLTGQVSDQTGAVIPGVEMTLTSKAGGVAQTTVSNQVGYYRFSFLRPGSYSLTAKKTGFADVVIPDITLQVQQTANVDVGMKPGAVVQTITVSAASVALETQTSSLGGVVGEQVTKQLPLLLRDPTFLVNLVPGVTNDNRSAGNTSGTYSNRNGFSYQGRIDFSINGGIRSKSTALVDGIDVTVMSFAFSSLPIVPSSDFTQEFKVQTNSLPAEFGRGVAVVNIVTKSGTNSFHGALFEFLQNDNLNAQDLFANTQRQLKPELKRNQYGLDVGGPIIKDKTFFFFDWENLRQLRFSSIATRVPTSAEAAGNFSNLYLLDGRPITIYNPYDLYVDPADGLTKRRPFANNQIPSNMVNPFALNVLKFFAPPNNPGLLAPGNLPTQSQNFYLAASAPLNFDKLDLKIDHSIGSAHRLMGRFSRSFYHVEPVDVFHNPATSQSLSTRFNNQPGKNGVFSWTWTMNPTTVLTQAVNYSRFIDYSRSQSYGYDPTSLGGPFADGSIVAYARKYTGAPAFPNISISGYAPMGDTTGNNFIEPFNNYTYQAGLVKQKGAHTLKTGFQYALRQIGEDFFTGGVGTYNFGGFTNGPNPLNPVPNSGNAMADFLLGLVRSGQLNTGYSNVVSSKYFAWYFQDDWRVTPKLTLNLGFRYDFERPFFSRHDLIARFDMQVPNPIGSSVGPNTGGLSLNQYIQNLSGHPINGGLIFPSSPQASGRGVVPTDWSNAAPRIGFAYRISDKLVMRGGFGRIYLPSSAAATVSGNGGGTLITSTPIVATVDGIRPLLTINNPFPSGFLTPIGDSQGLLSRVGDSLSAGATGQRAPYQWQWNFGFQYEASPSAVLSVAYGASRSRRLVCANLGVCTDQIPYDLIQKYKGQVLQSVPNPFYGIITDTRVALSSKTVQLGQLLKQWPQFTGWAIAPPDWLGPNGDDFRSAWDSLQVGFQKRYSPGLTILASYTLSKNLTNTDAFDGGFLGPTVGYQNMKDQTAERSLSAEDVTHRLVVGHVYDLPFGRQKRFGANWNSALDKIAGGWQASGFVTFQSGFPLPISVAGVQTGAFGGGVRPNVVPGVAPCLDTGRPRGQKILGYLNPAAFSVQPNFTFGNAPRTLNNCRGDGIKNYDMSIIKFIPVTERVKIEFRSEFFNLFNRPQLYTPNTSFNSGSFGRITAQANLPRVIQFGLKVVF